MIVLYKRTDELSDQEINEICLLFETVFEGEKKTPELFKNEFLNNCLGYSLHGLLYSDEGSVVGSNTYVPFKYIVAGNEKLVAVACDAMILKKYRDFYNIYNLISVGRKKLVEMGFSFTVCFPNDMAYPLYKKAFHDKELGNLSIYVLPYKISGIKRQLWAFNWLSMLFAKTVLLFSLMSQSKKTVQKLVFRERKSFETTRYKWFDPSGYNIVDKMDFHFVWKMRVIEGVRCALLFDVYPLCKRNFDAAVREVFKLGRKSFDMLMYVGHLDFLPCSLIKVPTRFEPKTFHFVGAVLDKSFSAPDGLFDVKNWEVDLASYDLI